MELRHLRYFLAAAQSEHFGRAAEQLRVAQPALSRRIADLEEELGVSLFDRTGRGVSLTKAGQIFRVDVDEILRRTEHAVEQARLAGEGKVGTLSIGFVESAAWHGAMPASFSEYRRLFPQVNLSLLPMSSAEQLEALDEGKIDAGFLYTHENQSDDLTRIRISTESVMLAAPRGHVLTSKVPLQLSDLTDVKIISLISSVAPKFFKHVQASSYDKGVELSTSAIAYNDSSLLSFVAAGMGVGLVTSTARWRKPQNVVLVPIANLDVQIGLEFVCRSEDSDTILNRFQETLAKKLKEPV